MRADAERNRAKVLEAAQEAFGAVGLSVPLDEIAQRAGVGPGTVYRHFPNKEALFRAVFVSRVERLVGEARALVAAEDAAEAFFAFLTHMIREGIAKRDLVEAMTGAGIDVGSTTPLTKELRAVLGELLTRAQRSGRVRADVDVSDIMALVAGTIFAARQHGGADGPSERALGVVCDGLRATGPPPGRSPRSGSGPGGRTRGAPVGAARL